jgi:PRD domain
MVSIADAFRERLDLLQASGQVTQVVREVTEALLGEVNRCFGPLDDDSAGMLVSHLALSLERLKRGERLEPDPLVQSEATQYPDELAEAAELARLAERLGAGPLPAGEVSFLAIHLRALKESKS